MKNMFIPFSIMQLLLLVWIHFNWSSGGLSDVQAAIMLSITLLILMGGLWYSYSHSDWMRPIVIAVAFSQCAISLVLKEVGIINWEAMLAIFIAWQVLMALCIIRNRIPVTDADDADPAPPPAPVNEKTPGR